MGCSIENTDGEITTLEEVDPITDVSHYTRSEANVFTFNAAHQSKTFQIKFVSSFAEPPDYHANFRPGVLEDSERYTIQVWGVNEDDEVITPTATLTLYPQNTPSGMYTITEFTVIE